MQIPPELIAPKTPLVFLFVEFTETTVAVGRLYSQDLRTSLRPTLSVPLSTDRLFPGGPLSVVKGCRLGVSLVPVLWTRALPLSLS